MRTFRRVPTVPVVPVALGVLLLAAATACGDGAAAPSAQGPHAATGTVTLTPPAPQAPLIATEWTVNSLLSGESAASVPAGVAGRARFTLSAAGSVSGNLGCNRFNARATVEGTSLTLGPLTMTRMACLGDAGEVERALTGLFDSGGPLTWRIQGQSLTLTAPDGKGLGAEAASAVE